MLMLPRHIPDNMDLIVSQDDDKEGVTEVINGVNERHPLVHIQVLDSIRT